MRIAVTGAAGRLGSAIGRVLGGSAEDAWLPLDRAAFDLDAPAGIGVRLDCDRPDAVIHAAAWTDVDGCARDPDLAQRRNGEATAVLAEACAARGIRLLLVSTNEVFDGERADRRGYEPGDPTHPANPYGASKLAAEATAAAAFLMAGLPDRLDIVRTAWLFGPGRPDFPRKIVVAAKRALEAGEPLRVVGDETGTPSSAVDVAAAIVAILRADGTGAVHHVVNAGIASRAEWARAIVGIAGLQVPIEELPLASFERPSRPPRWGVLAATALPGGATLRPWREAMDDEADRLRQAAG